MRNVVEKTGMKDGGGHRWSSDGPPRERLAEMTDPVVSSTGRVLRETDLTVAEPTSNA